MSSTIAAIPVQSAQLSLTNFVYGTLPGHIMRYDGCYYQYKQVEVSLDGAGNVSMIKPINKYVTSRSYEIYSSQSEAEADVIFVNLLFRKTTRVELGSTINVIRLIQHSITPIHLTTIHCTISSLTKKGHCHDYTGRARPDSYAFIRGSHTSQRGVCIC